jgi:hypothetical protein
VAAAGGSGNFVQYGWRADAVNSFASPTYDGIVQVASSGVCPYSLAAQDVDGNGLSELVTAKEVVSSDGAITSLSGGSVSGSSVVVDVNADSYADLIYVTLTGLKARLSVPSAMALVSTETRVGGVRCTYSTSENKITAIATQVSAVNPNSLLFSGEVRRDGQVVGTVSATQSNFIEFSPSSGGGQYQMKVIVEDTQEASIASATCNVTVPSTVSVVNETCSLVPDGEFNFATFSGTKWFTNILSSRAPGSFPALSGGIAKFTSPLQSISHALSCKAAALSVNIGLVDMATPTGTVTVSMLDEGIDGTSVDVASVLLVHQSGLWASDSTGSPVFVGAVGSGSHNITIVLYVDQQKYTVSLDGVGLKTLNFMNVARGAYSGVAVTGGSSGQLNVDFIKTSGSGAQRDLVVTTGKESLKGCVMNATYNGTTAYYEHVLSYCANTLTKKAYGFDTVCNADALMAAVKYNSECYKEAFNYCIDQTYPLDILKDSSGARGMDGATVCSTLLTGGGLLDKIVTPIWSVLWNYVAKNAILVFSIIFLVIIVATLSGKRK